MTVEEMKQRMEELRAQQTEAELRSTALYTEARQTRDKDLHARAAAESERADSIFERWQDLEREIENHAKDEREFRLRVINTARQTWIHTPDEEKTKAWFKELFSNSELFERAANDYLDTSKTGETK